MTNKDIELLKKKIEKAEVVSFDIFDTLLLRKTNNPETIFDLIGKHFSFFKFRKYRMDSQTKASIKAWEEHKYPHANIDEIYDHIKRSGEYQLDWDAVKQYEIDIEKDAVVANEEMLDIFHYAKKLGKRVVATSDMYLMASTLEEMLEKCGFIGFDKVYCSADERKAKFNRDLFEAVAVKEAVDYCKVLHIGDKERDDGEFPRSYGMDAFVYNRDVDLSNVSKAISSDIDNGLYNILYNDKRNFWYNFGIEAGGPLYIGLVRWIKDIIGDKKVYFLSRDGYNLYSILKNMGYTNVEYLYMSRRSILLAGITELDDESLKELPPYTKGQRIKDIFDYLCIPSSEVLGYESGGLADENVIIKDDSDIAKVKKLLVVNSDAILQRCKIERENAIEYFSKKGFFEHDSYVFDCGWSGSSQFLLERFKRAINSDVKNYFLYFGIRSTEKSMKQLHLLDYKTFAFDFYNNFTLQRCALDLSVVLIELLFSAPHASVFYYDANGEVVFEDTSDDFKGDILEGIKDYISLGLNFAEGYDVEYTPEIALGHLHRIIENPTVLEATNIGDVGNVDGFAKGNETKYIAKITKNQLLKNPEIEVYWVQGFLKRNDISEELKEAVARRSGIAYPDIANEKYHLEDQASIVNYRRWMRHQNKVNANSGYDNADKNALGMADIMFSVVIPVYNTESTQLTEAIESVLGQTYTNYELILVDDKSTWENVARVLKKYEGDEKVKVIYRNENGHISAATNDGIFASSGDYIVFMDCDDVIEDNALSEFAKYITAYPEVDFIYSDEDKITEDGLIRHLPFFKPDWSPDLFRTMMYTNHLATYRASIVKDIGGLRSKYDGCQDYDMTLRFMEKTDNSKVGHIHQVLYHWRERKESVAYSMSSKNYATEATKYIKEEMLARNNIKGHAEYIYGFNQYRIVYDVIGNPMVSIVIPSKDNPKMLFQCIESIHRHTDYANYEIIIVDNGSSIKNKNVIDAYLKKCGHKYIYEPRDFNFSAMCNAGVSSSAGEYILFLNDDVEVFQHDWLDRLLGQAMQTGIGAVGPKLYYPNSTNIQFAGAANIVEGPSHNFMHQNDFVPHYFGMNWVDYNCSIITGACLLVSKKIFNEVGGFDEGFPIAYNDVDLCFSIVEHGYYNVVRNDVVAFHHESFSRGTDMISDEKLFRLSGEKQALYYRHSLFKKTDRFLNANVHNYGYPLDLMDCYDEVSEVELINEKAFDSSIGNVDKIEINENVRFYGWIRWIKERENEARYVLLRDPYGKVLKIETNSCARDDVYDSFGKQEQYRDCGFFCCADKNMLRLDMFRYQLGLLVEYDGDKEYYWTDAYTNIIKNAEPRTEFCWLIESSSVDDKRIAADNVKYNIEKCNRIDNGWEISGWAFCNENTHYLYNISIELECGNVVNHFDAQRQDRIDVASVFPNVSFLYNTGFTCNIWKDYLETGKEYRVIIRLDNIYDKKDVKFVKTEHVISV